MDKSWNPWKVTTIGMAVVMATALVTGLVVANWTGNDPERTAVVQPGKPVAESSRAMARPARRVASVPAVPTKAAIDACNKYAAQQTGRQDKTVVVKDAAAGLNENKKKDEAYRAAYSSCMKHRGYSS